MSEVKHTPGPWFACPDLTLMHIRNALGSKIATLRQDGTEDEADARLIAAAPELLDALKDLSLKEFLYRRAHDLYGSGDRITGQAWDRMRRAGDKARSAIAKAEGKDDFEDGAAEEQEARREQLINHDVGATREGWQT